MDKTFSSASKNDLWTNDNIPKFATSEGNDYTTGCLLDYPYFKEQYKVIAIDLSKQQELHADSKAIIHISSAGNLEKYQNTNCENCESILL